MRGPVRASGNVVGAAADSACLSASRCAASMQLGVLSSTASGEGTHQLPDPANALPQHKPFPSAPTSGHLFQRCVQTGEPFLIPESWCLHVRIDGTCTHNTARQPAVRFSAHKHPGTGASRGYFVVNVG